MSSGDNPPTKACSALSALSIAELSIAPLSIAKLSIMTTMIETHPLQFPWTFTFFKKAANKGYEENTSTLGTTESVRRARHISLGPVLPYANPVRGFFHGSDHRSLYPPSPISRSRTSGVSTSTCGGQSTTGRPCATTMFSARGSSRCGRTSRT